MLEADSAETEIERAVALVFVEALEEDLARTDVCDFADMRGFDDARLVPTLRADFGAGLPAVVELGTFAAALECAVVEVRCELALADVTA